MSLYIEAEQSHDHFNVWLEQVGTYDDVAEEYKRRQSLEQPLGTPNAETAPAIKAPAVSAPEEASRPMSFAKKLDQRIDGLGTPEAPKALPVTQRPKQGSFGF